MTRAIHRGIGLLLVACWYAGMVAAMPPKTSKRRHAKPKPTAHAPAPTTRASASIPTPMDPPPLSTMPVSDYLQVGWWRGDGSGVDETGQNNGSPTGGVGYVPAMDGRGFRFAGRDDAVTVRDSPSLALTRSLTINAWINVDAFPTPDENMGMVLFRGDDRGGLDPYTLGVGSDQRLGFHIESETAQANLSAPISGRRFVMITALLDDSTGKMELYENTVLVARTITTVRPLAQLDPGQYPAVGIGNCNALPGSAYRYPFHGVINNLRVWGRVLAPGEIRSLYAGSLSVPSPLVPKPEP